MRLLSLLTSVPFALSLACSTVSAGERSQAPARAAAGKSAGNVAGTLIPDALTTAAIEALRAQGPAGLAIALERHDAAFIDKVAGQRYATESRLFWYQDLAQAKAAARASGKPILSLRMLGRLDEDLSCANSRFFRTILYPDAAVGALLRDQFILHWSSERNVPRVTVDFGDGRKLESTVTGNSAHYVLDADGRPIDVLPGVYAPQMFVRELEVAARLHASLRNLDAHQRTVQIYEHHRAAMQLAADRWAAFPPVPVIVGARRLLDDKTVVGAAAAAQRATVSKAFVEVPMLRTVDLGVDPGKLPDDIELWAEIGRRMLAFAALPDGRTVGVRPVLDPHARKLVDRLLREPLDGVQLDDAARAAVLARLEQTIVADTALNEVRLRPMIRSHLMDAWNLGPVSFEDVNTWVYANVFHTPATDAWMGLLPRDTFTGLPGGAVISRR